MSGMEVTNITKNFLARMLKEGKRFDGRKLFDVNDLKVSYDVSNKAEGSARVILGKTEVVVGVKMGIETPYPDSKDRGNLMVSGDLLPLASPRFEAGPPQFNAIELPRLIDRIIRESKVIDLKKLVIKEGEKVWSVIIDIYPINDDGSLVDAAAIGAIAALHNTFLPGITEDMRPDYEKKTKERLPLKDLMPLAVTFYKLGDSLFIQPTREEEESCDTKVIFGVSEDKGKIFVNACQKGWETSMTSEEIGVMMDEISEVYKKIKTKLSKFIK